MDLVGLASPFLKVAEKLETIVNKVYERGDIIEDNRDDFRRLVRHYERAHKELKHLENVPTWNPITLGRLDEFKTTLQEENEKLTELETQIDNASRNDRVKRMKEILCRCREHVKEFFEFVDKVSPMLEAQSSLPDVYIPCCAVPVNPPRLTLHYDTDATCEGRLRAAVLRDTGSQVVAVVASGQGGVGKTCALRGLAYHEQVQKRFPGGILYIQLGGDATSADVVKGIADMVEETGGSNLARVVGAAQSVQKASRKAAKWFRRYTCLFLVDDIWHVNGIDSEVLTTLGSMVNSNSRLVYTTRDRRFLDRADEVVEFVEKETFGRLSRQMLMKHASFGEMDQLDEKNQHAFEAILEICQGLPLAFGIAGGSVLRNSRRKSSERRQDAWSMFHGELLAKETDLLAASAVQYGHLSKIVDGSLLVLDSVSNGENYCKRFRSFCVLQKQQRVPLQVLQKLWNLEELSDAKRVIEKFEEVSIAQRSREGDCFQLHDLILDIAVHKAKKEGETQMFFRTFVDNYVSSCLREHREDVLTHPNRHSDVSVQSDNAVNSTDPHDASPVRRVKRLFGALTRNCFQIDQTTIADDCQTTASLPLSHAWWSADDDGFIHDNVCRMLRNAGDADELLQLLSEPQWIVKRLVESGFHSVEQDVDHGKAVARDNCFRYPSHQEHLEMIRRAAKLSALFVNNNPREVWFQMHGRLLWHAKQCELTRNFVQAINKRAPRPWLKASEGFLQQAGGSALEVVRGPGFSGRVLCTTVERDEIWILWDSITRSNSLAVGIYDRTTTNHKCVQLVFEGEREEWITNVTCASFLADRSSVVTAHEDGNIVTWNRQTGIRKHIVEHKCQHHERLIDFFEDGTRFACEVEDHSIRLWDAQSGNAIGKPLRGHTGSVWCVAMSADGTRIVSGSSDSTVRVWDARSGDAIGEPLQGHTSWVECLAMNTDGTRIVSGSIDCTVRVWNALSGDAVGPPLQGHAGGVECVAVSADGTRIVSGSSDKTVRIWDAHSGNEVGQPLEGHTHWVRCVAVSADGTSLVSGSFDNTVRVWDTQRCNTVEEPLQGHTDKVECVAITVDGTRIISGSWDKTVRRWDARSGNAVGKPIEGHTSRVECVAVSADATRIVSGSNDCTVHVWDAHSGHAVGQPLRGHSGAVVCVGLSADGTMVVSDDGHLQRLWELGAGGAKCVLTSGDTAWQRTVAKLTLTWSSRPWHAPWREVIDGVEDGSPIVLGTCEEEVQNFNDGDVYFTKRFRSCRIVR